MAVSAIDWALQARDRSRTSREAAARTRWSARKERSRARRLRAGSGALLPPALDDFVEVSSLDELIGVLLVLGRKQHGSGDEAA